MSATQVGDVARSQSRYGPLPMSVRNHCPACRCYVTRSATSCGACGASFVPLTPGYAQVTSVVQR